MGVKIYLSKTMIAARVMHLAREITESGYENLLVVPVLTSAFVFTADLIRELHRTQLALEVQFLSVVRVGLVNRIDLPTGPFLGRDILLVDDSVGTGFTFAEVRRLLITRGARRVEACALLDVPEKRRTRFRVDHIGFECKDQYYVGYGMDSDSGRYRELPYVGICDDGDDAAYHAKMAAMPEAIEDDTV